MNIYVRTIVLYRPIYYVPLFKSSIVNFPQKIVFIRNYGILIGILLIDIHDKNYFQCLIQYFIYNHKI